MLKGRQSCGDDVKVAVHLGNVNFSGCSCEGSPQYMVIYILELGWFYARNLSSNLFALRTGTTDSGLCILVAIVAHSQPLANTKFFIPPLWLHTEIKNIKIENTGGTGRNGKEQTKGKETKEDDYVE